MPSVQFEYKEPQFSLVIPTRDRPDLVTHCLACIRRQTFNSFEIILSDNGSLPLSRDVYSTYLDDPRFKYIRPDQDMNMADHWEFAVSYAKGQYVTVLSEKFMLRPDALSVLADLVHIHHPDIITWQFDRYEVSLESLYDAHGHYHPLMKPVPSSFYDPKEELRRRFSFETPVFSRTLRHKNSYGKIYSGCVRRKILDNIRHDFNRIFHPYIPDFSSMVAILNEANTAMDVGQSLMLVVFADGISTGDATKVSLSATHDYFNSYNNSFEDYSKFSLFDDCWIGHNSFIAFDYQRMKNLAVKGPILNVEVDLVNLFSWMLRDLTHVKDFGDFSKAEIEYVYRCHYDKFDIHQQNRIKFNLSSLENESPCQFEIFHSGLIKTDSMPANVTPIVLAEMHWCEGVAPPRKNVLFIEQGIQDAVGFLYQYNIHSLNLLNIKFRSELIGNESS